MLMPAIATSFFMNAVGRGVVEANSRGLWPRRKPNMALSKRSLLISHSRDFIDHHHLGLMAAEAFRGSSPEKVHTLRAGRPLQAALVSNPFRHRICTRGARDAGRPSRLTSCMSAVVGAIRWVRDRPARIAVWIAADIE